MRKNKSLRIFIFVNRRTDGIAKLKVLLEDIDEKDVLRVRVGRFEAVAELKDGTRYQVVGASDNSRGYKGDRAYVERRVAKEVLDNIIVPCLASSCLPASERIEFFSAEEVL